MCPMHVYAIRVCVCMPACSRLFPPVTWAFDRAEDGWTSALWEFNSFHFPACLTLSVPHIRYALHLKSHMARYICTLSLVHSLSTLPWALQPAPHWYSTSFSLKVSSLELYFVPMPSKYQRIPNVWYWLWPLCLFYVAMTLCCIEQWTPIVVGFCFCSYLEFLFFLSFL